MKTLTIISGKGGAGKTTLSSNLSVILSKEMKIVAADCDADAPNLGLALGIKDDDFSRWEMVQTNEKAVLDEERCDGCKKCFEVCNFGAISWDEKRDRPVFNSMLCEGCGACQLVCPKKAIKLAKVYNGKIGEVDTKYGFPLFSGQLNVGATGSGKIVSLIKQKAEERALKDKKELILVDSAAGVGCPVIASIQGSDYIAAVTEPTPSGLSDLKRALKTADHFRIPYGIVINKFDLNIDFSKKIERFAKNKGIAILGRIPYNKKIVEALVELKPAIEYDKTLEPIFNEILSNILKKLEEI